MDVQLHRFARYSISPAEKNELVRVDALADQLFRHLEGSADEINAVHIHDAKSMAVQRIVGSLLLNEIGFGEEIVLTPQDGFSTRARPDFFFDLGQGRGILAEVERGGTVNNNHDLKDLWKAHIATDAQHLFLVVPNSNWEKSGKPRERPYPRVVHRFASFFGDARREVDVLSVHIFGYGRLI